MQTQITRQCVIKEETEELGEKPLRRPPSGNNPLDNQLAYMGEQKTLQA